jgi:arylsulfatase A-like enzyme
MNLRPARHALLAAALCFLAAHPSLPAAAPHPNVIVIMADDQGSVDLGSYGSADLHTPHVDALAKSGVRFTQFYAGSAVCSPSRACLLTGRYPSRTGLVGNAGSGVGAGDRAGLPPAEITLAEMFKAAGYATAQIGKWHLGASAATHPNAQGFDHSFGHLGGCIDNYSHFFYWSGPNVHDLQRNGTEIFEDGRYFPDLMLAEASAFMERNRARPFFLYYAVNTPHYPYQGEPRWLEHFKHLPLPRRLYAAFLASQDERIGALLAKVAALGLRERTIVVFQSDNGHSVEERAHGGGGSAGPYRGAKFSLFEGGIRMPAILAFPGTVPAGAVRDQIAHAADWLPTLAALTGVAPPAVTLDGHDLGPVLRSAAAPGPRRALHWQMGESWAVRDGDWKLIANPRDPTAAPAERNARTTLFLAHLAADPGERTNLAERHPDIVARLEKLHDTFLDPR